ncbi:Na(+)/H(+) antiporter subunit C [Aquibacillus koreensis]|uniref:Na(+)/H(+) antiporter subunit C n=1 Tax=Aquibacillus koreensis TaxID=279446 RepID=A0A9X3WP88_9BACI|nr:Na(+)/H(+) antiporter subunit C [Aquibacillus koreensis]MCT2538197.1 Na(+)/H(+) antiporter subunit C [Aquibacillus koreensis]MDC3420859.1 Na(+)/H(+) antiporter subunit C [Aquibacillus koreensis]
MEILMVLLVGLIFTVATYLVLTKSLLRVVLGLVLFSHGAHTLILTMGGLGTGDAPILGASETYTDPLPQALILTAIVISFGVTAFLLVMAYRTYKVHKTDDLDQLRGSSDE